MGRVVDRAVIFDNDADRDEFANRVAALCQEGALAVYAWALMPNHFHLLVRTGATPLGQSMHALLKRGT
jgi:putative transposase